MITFQYKSFLCFEEDIESILNEYGANGWRLHTCEPYVISGSEGVGSVKFIVVMDQAASDEEPVPDDEKTSEGIAMTG